MLRQPLQRAVDGAGCAVIVQRRRQGHGGAISSLFNLLALVAAAFAAGRLLQVAGTAAGLLCMAVGYSDRLQRVDQLDETLLRAPLRLAVSIGIGTGTGTGTGGTATGAA